MPLRYICAYRSVTCQFHLLHSWLFNLFITAQAELSKKLDADMLPKGDDGLQSMMPMILEMQSKLAFIESVSAVTPAPLPLVCSSVIILTVVCDDR